jgi:hypothetical protein
VPARSVVVARIVPLTETAAFQSGSPIALLVTLPETAPEPEDWAEAGTVKSAVKMKKPAMVDRRLVGRQPRPAPGPSGAGKPAPAAGCSRTRLGEHPCPFTAHIALPAQNGSGGGGLAKAQPAA